VSKPNCHIKKAIKRVCCLACTHIPYTKQTTRQQTYVSRFAVLARLWLPPLPRDPVDIPTPLPRPPRPLPDPPVWPLPRPLFPQAVAAWPLSERVWSADCPTAAFCRSCSANKTTTATTAATTVSFCLTSLLWASQTGSHEGANIHKPSCCWINNIKPQKDGSIQYTKHTFIVHQHTNSVVISSETGQPPCFTFSNCYKELLGTYGTAFVQQQ